MSGIPIHRSDDPGIIEAPTANRSRLLSFPLPSSLPPSFLPSEKPSSVTRALLHCHPSSRPEQMSVSNSERTNHSRIIRRRRGAREGWLRSSSVATERERERKERERERETPIIARPGYSREYPLSTCSGMSRESRRINILAVGEERRDRGGDNRRVLSSVWIYAVDPVDEILFKERIIAARINPRSRLSNEYTRRNARRGNPSERRCYRAHAIAFYRD